MPGAPRAAVSANYRAALYFSTREPKKERGGEKRGFGISGFNSLYFPVFSKLPIRRNYQCHKMAAT